MLEVKYTTRDYLLDLETQEEDQIDGSVGTSDEGGTSHVACHEQRSDLPTMATTQMVGNEFEVTKSEGSSSVSIIKSTATNSTPITEQNAVDWREKICEWSYQVADHFDLARDIVFITLNYTDRVCAASNALELLRDKNRFQLLAMATLCVAIKVHGEVDTNVQGAESCILDTILHLGRGYFTAKELKLMELEALQRMQWLLHPPTPQTFVTYFIELFQAEETVELNDIAMYIVELSVHDYFFASSKPSVIALAALWNASRMLGRSELWISDIQDDLLKHNEYEESANIDVCRYRLEKLYANTGTKLEDFVEVPVQRELGHAIRTEGVLMDKSPTSVMY